jgi:hypothetical protein
MSISEKIVDKALEETFKYVQKRPLFTVARRILNILFTSNIASFLLEKYFYKYTWLDVSDYKGILNFFVRGTYLLPLALFVVTYIIIGLISEAIMLITMNIAFSILIKKKWVKELQNIIVQEYFKTHKAHEIIAFKKQLSRGMKESKEVLIFYCKAILVVYIFVNTHGYNNSVLFKLIYAILIAVLIWMWCFRLFISLLRSRIVGELKNAASEMNAVQPGQA